MVVINLNTVLKHGFETQKKGAIQFKTVFLLKHGFENLINATAISNMHGLNDVTMIEIEKRAPCLTFCQGTSCAE